MCRGFGNIKCYSFLRRVTLAIYGEYCRSTTVKQHVWARTRECGGEELWSGDIFSEAALPWLDAFVEMNLWKSRICSKPTLCRVSEIYFCESDSIRAFRKMTKPTDRVSPFGIFFSPRGSIELPCRKSLADHADIVPLGWSTTTPMYGELTSQWFA